MNHNHIVGHNAIVPQWWRMAEMCWQEKWLRTSSQSHTVKYPAADIWDLYTSTNLNQSHLEDQQKDRYTKAAGGMLEVPSVPSSGTALWPHHHHRRLFWRNPRRAVSELLSTAPGPPPLPAVPRSQDRGDSQRLSRMEWRSTTHITGKVLLQSSPGLLDFRHFYTYCNPTCLHSFVSDVRRG